MNKNLKIGIGNAVLPETNVFHGSVYTRDAFGRTTDLVTAWLAKDHQVSQKVSGDLRVLIQGLLEFCFPKDQTTTCHLEVGPENDYIYVAVRFSNFLVAEGEDVEKKLSQHWLKSDEAALIKKILYPHDRVEVRFLKSLNLIEWRIVRFVGLGSVNMDIPSFLIIANTPEGLDTDHDKYTEMGDMPYEEWLAAIYQNDYKKSRAGDFTFQGESVQNEQEWARIVLEREASQVEDAVNVFSNNNAEQASDQVQTIIRGSSNPEDTSNSEIRTFKSSSGEDDANSEETLVTGQKVTKVTEEEVTIFEEDEVEDGAEPGVVKKYKKVKAVNEEITVFERDEEVEEENSEVVAKKVAAPKVKKKATEVTIIGGDTPEDDHEVRFKAGSGNASQDVRVPQDKSAPMPEQSNDLSFQVDASSILGEKVGSSEPDYSEVRLKADAVAPPEGKMTVKSTTESVVDHSETEVKPVTGSNLEVAALKEKLAQYEKLLKRKELQNQKTGAEIQQLRKKIEEISQGANKQEARTVQIYKEKALQMYEMVKNVKLEKQALEKALFEAKKSNLNLAAAKSLGGGEGASQVSPIDDDKKKLERVTRALEAEKAKVKTLSERVTFAEKEAQGATPLIEDLEQKLETALKLSQTQKKETEAVKQKLVQSEQEKNKVKNDLLKAQAQIQTLVKRQAS